MRENKSRIVLEDYKNDFSYEKKKSNLNINFNRISFIFFIFFLISLIYIIHLVHLGSRKTSNFDQNLKDKFVKELYRADITDRNGRYLAKTVSSIDIGINPVEIIDQKKLLVNLKLIFPNKNFNEIEKLIKKNKFFWFEKKISEESYERIMKLGDKSIKPEEKLTRLYPQKNLFSHIVGQIDDDNIGISGLEKTLDRKLKETNKPIQLTVDEDIQYLIRKELIKFNNIFDANGSAAILMNVNNGEILSLVSLPDFDLNQRQKIEDINFINRATKGVYELGSVFKTFTLAAALNEKIVETNTEFVDLEKSIRCGGNTISEYDLKIPSNLTAEEILIRSGNIGSVRIGQKLGLEKFMEYMNKFDLMSQMNFDIEEMGVPLKLRWGKCKLATASFGHGITTTPIQLAKAYSIVSNGGYEIHPTLIKKDKTEIKKRILDQEVSFKINNILRKIVTTKEGTASLANVNGYEVGGKTGTAQKIINGNYSNKKINTFASIFPISNPKFTLVVMLDEPKTNKDYIYTYRDGSGKYKGTPFNTAGWTSVEIVGQIIDKIGPILATKYIEVD
ncbi:MAG: cell division protein FtsI [Pelagibacteraceae bacterium BACL5 MAG-120820-bin39]|jgi:cell division protein FtsI (penicillin-binding protein 3)|nr:MAG: cell division protein FtsI [Pelagibacteraceae bacterium BACL5 MAG-120820-bin39]